MLREPQHERKIVNVINVIPVRTELSRRADEVVQQNRCFIFVFLGQRGGSPKQIITA